MPSTIAPKMHNSKWKSFLVTAEGLTYRHYYSKRIQARKTIVLNWRPKVLLSLGIFSHVEDKDKIDISHIVGGWLLKYMYTYSNKYAIQD